MTGAPWLIATRSAGKLRELRPLFAEWRVAVTDLAAAGINECADEAAIECHDTFEENALAKARYFYSRSAGRPTVADDSGLEVLALNGRPGVHSKRWSGRDDLYGAALDEANNAALLGALAGCSDRTARYVCVAVYVDGEVELIARGECTGHILLSPRGPGGFGYDPFFYSDELGSTFGEASGAAKQKVSHRGRAFNALMERLTSSVDLCGRRTYIHGSSGA